MYIKKNKFRYHKNLAEFPSENSERDLELLKGQTVLFF